MTAALWNVFMADLIIFAPLFMITEFFRGVHKECGDYFPIICVFIVINSCSMFNYLVDTNVLTENTNLIVGICSILLGIIAAIVGVMSAIDCQYRDKNNLLKTRPL